MPTKLGVVGLSKNGGWASSNLIPPVLAKPLSDSFVLTALSTTSETSAEATAAHYTELTQSEVKPYHGETTAIAADSNVDLVVVSVHVQYHKDAALPVIAAGKDVFVEWPLGKNLEEAKIMTLAAQERGVRHAVGLQSWNVPAFAKVKELLQANKIGRIVSSSWYSAKSPTVGANAPRVATYALKYRNPAMGGTYLDIPIAHNLSAITHALGNLRYVNSTFAVGFPEVKVADSEDAPNPRYIRNHHNLPDQWSISGVFESGALFSGTWISLGKNLPSGQPSMVWEVVGTDGVIRVESRNAYTGFAPALALPEVLLVNGESVDLTEANAAMSAVGWAWDAWARGDKAKIPTFEDALDLHRLIEAIKQSHKQGRRVYVSETA